MTDEKDDGPPGRSPYQIFLDDAMKRPDFLNPRMENVSKITIDRDPLYQALSQKLSQSVIGKVLSQSDMDVLIHMGLRQQTEEKEETLENQFSESEEMSVDEIVIDRKSVV
jgi:hypothetical protein